MQSERIGEIAVSGRNISLDSVRHGVHTGMSDELLRHSLGELGVDNRDIRRDLEVGDRVLDALRIVGYDRESRYLGRRAGRRGDSAEMSLPAELRDSEDLAHILEGDFRILVLDPHSLSRVDRRTSADSDYPVRLELHHRVRAAHDRLDRRVRLNALEELNFHSGFLQVVHDLVEETESLHASAARTYDSLLALEGLQRVKRVLSVVNISR